MMSRCSPVGLFLYTTAVIGLFTIQGSHAAEVQVEPRDALVLPQQNVTFMCRTDVPLQYCRVEIPGEKPFNLNSRLSNPTISYYGAGLNAGQCGFTIHSVKEKNNGQVKCTLGFETDVLESIGTMQLIVAKAPEIPELDLSRGTDSVHVYKINELLHASCLVRNGRPVANISWFLDDEPLYRDGLSMPTVVDLAKENLQSKLQNLTRQLQATDNGRSLRCVAYHPAYPGGQADTIRQLNVKYAPLPQRDLDKFGYIIGQPGLITVEIESNPKPQIEWLVGGQKIKEGRNDDTGRIEAEAARDLGNGRYEVNLRIAAIKKEDTEKEYILTAYNDMGNQDYRIKISTSPEPEGLDLGIGSIIGIVVAILVVLLVGFLIVFAKITDRWCFSGYQDQRHLGESSDTESADVRPNKESSSSTAGGKSPNFPTIKLTSFFRKNKDPINTKEVAEDDVEAAQPIPPEGATTETTATTAAEATDDVKLSLDEATETPKQQQEQEGLVYAELDLISPNVLKAVVKSDDDKTEYAEIVYAPIDEDGGGVEESNNKNIKS